MRTQKGDAQSKPVESGAGTPAPLDFGDPHWDVDAAAELARPMRVKDPRTGRELGPVFRVYGADARSYRTNMRRLMDAVNANPEREPADEDDALLLSRARQAAAALEGWEDVAFNGEPLECTADNAVELMRKRTWLADQVLAFTNNRGNYPAA